jgi:hypothetical protein
VTAWEGYVVLCLRAGSAALDPIIEVTPHVHVRQLDLCGSFWRHLQAVGLSVSAVSDLTHPLLSTATLETLASLFVV